ncbi:MAG: DUF973 family protein [Thermoplasmata archaeon]
MDANTNVDDAPDRIRPNYFVPVTPPPEGDAGADEAPSPIEVPADAEKRGIQRARWASLIAVLGLAVAGIGPFILILATGVALPFLGTIFGDQALTLTLLYGILGLIAAGVLLDVVAFILYTTSFGLLRHVDAGFRAPRALGIVGVIGFLMLALGPTVILLGLLSAVSCASAGGGTGCVNAGTFVLGAAMILLGAVLSFVGWIGLILGVFRMGSRYGSGLLKVAAILFIVPIASIVAPLLAFVALGKVAPLDEDPSA